MNTQPAIEAAKIAAETAAHNAQITAVITIFIAIITSLITLWSAKNSARITKELGEKNLKSLEQKRYIDAISTERIKWINTMRDAFSEYLKLTHIQMNDFHKWKNEGKESIKESELRERSFEINYLNNQIYLLSNNTEPIIQKLIELQGEVTNTLCRNDVVKFDDVKITEWANDIGYLQQVILKAEWRRVKEENKLGEEITDEKMNEIFMSTAKHIDPVRFDHLGFQEVKLSDEITKTEEGSEISKRYKYLHWIIKGYAILALLIVINMFLSFLNINCLSVFGSKQIETLITLAGFLFTMFALIPVIEEKYKQK
ncbi:MULTISPECIES: hypothetical protein [Bacillus cereus group]|uniref:hypothetical protein n=1 Tax=Bacillus cereus group TaxID=86661 RepID=UPI000BFE7B62|nr:MULTISPECIES: hypothetical protein [Bacillus cereus group]PGM03797.1 hypothetical protein CN938_29785 [Bacillus thuringiensis]